jgi:zinc protease
MIERYTLKNGIPVFVVENHASPVVTVQAWISRGSVYETEKLAGISHFLEHSLFKGTKNRNVGEIALEIETCGGEINAFTSFEETVYYTTLGSRYFEKGMDIIADAVQNPTFDPEEMLR